MTCLFRVLLFLVKAIADACKVSGTFVSELTESEVPEASEVLFNEDQELQQLIDGKICMKVYPFPRGIAYL